MSVVILVDIPDFDGSSAGRGLAELVKRGGNLRVVFQSIGEWLVESTQHRFDTSTGPDGEQWAPISPASYDIWLNRSGGGNRFLGRDGRLNDAGTEAVAARKPLLDTGRLKESIAYQLGNDNVMVGTNVEYAATHQFGAAQGAFGATKRGAPIPYGAIPARPYLGISAEDARQMEELIGEFLLSDLA